MATNRRGDHDHRLRLASGWQVWRHFCLRAAGFPVRDVLRLACRDTAALVDQRLDAEREAATALAEVRAACAELGAELAARGDRDGIKRVRRLVRLLAREVPSTDLLGDDGCRALERCRSAQRRCETLSAAIAASFGQERTAAIEALREHAQDERFREAIAWQNRSALRFGVDRLLRTSSADDNVEAREKRRLVASYLQRYCTKNDSIGFFGPLGWGQFSDDERPMRMVPGSALVSRRVIHFEHWAVDAIAAALTHVPGLRPLLAPRLVPAARLEGRTLALPGMEVALSAPEAALLSACDGRRPARAIAAAHLARSAATADGRTADPLAMLAELAERGWIIWRLDVPTVGWDGERVLRAELERLPEPEVRRDASEAMTPLELARDAVAAATGDSRGVADALDALDEAFTRLTGRAANRSAGETYAGRTLLIEDCGRDLELVLGAPLRRRLGAPLGLLLDSCRWYSHRAAAAYKGALAAVFEELRRSHGGAPLALTSFLAVAGPHIPRLGGKAPPAMETVLSEYQARWRALIAPEPGARRVHRAAAQLAEPARALFAAPGPGWPTARFHSPDVMIAAASAAAVAAGELRFVLGETHCSTNTLEQEWIYRMSAHPEELSRWLDLDVPTGRLSPVVSKADAVRGRTVPFSTHPLDLEVEIDDALGWRPAEQRLPIRELVVDQDDRGVVIRTRDGRRTWTLIEALDLLLSDFNVPLWPPAEHQPRVTIDDLVVTRETWELGPDRIAELDTKDRLDRFVAARRVARDLGLPRFVFVRSPREIKPVFVDLESPLLVDSMIRLATGAQSLRVSEMLPGPEDCWLADAEGRTYTAELRLIAVDDTPWSPESSAEG